MNSKARRSSIAVQGATVTVLHHDHQDFICLTDIAKFKNPDHSDDVIRNWLRNRGTVEFLGVWERLNNPAFNPVEFDGIRLQTGLNSFVLTPKQWRDAHSSAEGNLRDHAPLEQLVVLTNLESLNAVLIRQGLGAPERLLRLNEIAITQMRTLLAEPNVKRLK